MTRAKSAARAAPAAAPPKAEAPGGKPAIAAPEPSGPGRMAIATALRGGNGGGEPLDAATRGGAEARLGVPLDGVRVRRGPEAEREAGALGARAFTTGSTITLGRAADRGSLAHELVHVAQARRHGPPGPNLPALDAASPAEAEARALAPRLLSGAAPPGPPTPPRARPGAQVERETPPVSAAPTPVPAPAAADTGNPPGWSFDPYAEDLAGLGNRDLVRRLAEERDWLRAHTIIELDYEPHEVLLDRLNAERDWRIDLGHVWLEEAGAAGATGSPELYRLMPGQAGAMDVVRVEDAGLIDNGAQDLGGQPVMTTAQFHAWLGRSGLPSMSAAEFLSSRGGEGDRDASGLPAGAVSMAPGRSSARMRSVALGMAQQNARGRVGAYSEAHFGTGRSALYGFGATDMNAVLPNHPLTDFRMMMGAHPDLSVKSRIPGPLAGPGVSRLDIFGNYLEGHAKLLDMSAGTTSFERFMEESARGRDAATVRREAGLVVNADDAAAYRSLLSDPHAREPTPSGGTSETPNYRRAEVSRIYDGVLRDAPVEIGDGKPPLRTVAEIDAALASGRIGIMQHDSYLRRAGMAAAAGVHANSDFDMRTARAYEAGFEALPESLRPQPPPPPPRRWSASRRADTATGRADSRVERYDSYLRNHAEMLAAGGTALHIDPADVPAFQTLLREPYAREPTAGGKASPRPNYRRASVTPIYDAVLGAAPVRSAAGEAFTSVAALDEALRAGRLTQREHFALLQRTGRLAARTVVPDTPGSGVDPAHAAAEAEYRRRMAAANEHIRTNNSAEHMASLAHGGGLRGDLHAAGRYGGRGALFSAGLGMGMEGISMWRDGVENPDALERLGHAGAREGTRGGLSTAAETVAVSRTSAYLLREGLEVSAGRALAMRTASRAVPGGAVDLGFEWYDMATNDREESGGEVAYRSSRAFVIGAGSGLLATAAGTAATAALAGSVVPGVGTAVGFVVGFLVGLGVGLAMGAAIPTWDELGSGGSEPDRSHHVYSQSQFDRMRAEGRCLPSHHQSFEVVPDHLWMGEFTAPMRDVPGLLGHGAAPASPNAHASPPVFGLRQPRQPMSDSEMAALRAWIEGTPAATPGAAAH